MNYKLYFLALSITLFLFACGNPQKEIINNEQAQWDKALLSALPSETISFSKQIKPLLNQRCVVCHGCYDAPCQLKLSSPEGLQRGASKLKVYDGSRILGASPTRLFIDAKNTAEWRDKGFYTVLSEGNNTPQNNIDNSVLYKMLRLKQINPQAGTSMLGDHYTLDLDRKQSCPTLTQFDRFSQQHPEWGMPYALPNLKEEEYKILTQWLAQGSPIEPAKAIPDASKQQIHRWETFLNGTTLKQKLVSRYLYEHLFQTHLHFKNSNSRTFYRLVRSRTPGGKPVDEIATLRPYADPGSEFYYRITPYTPAIVAKDHIVYEFSNERLQRIKKLFLQADYQVSTLPGYDPIDASNPFKTFRELPADARYRFLLDDARVFIEGFIKGSVCRGQIALNVIEDQFWVFFLDPEIAKAARWDTLLHDMSDYLQMPAGKGNTFNLLSIWTNYWKQQKTYIAAKQQHIKATHPKTLNDAMQHIWDGDDSNPNAALTIFRHFDSASITHGLIGDYPESAWVLDYPLLERIHYLLVAGFNVYGNVGHQLNTRLYMDFLRMEGEDNFLTLLPTENRKAIRDGWYQGIRHNLPKQFSAPMDWLSIESVAGYQTDNPQLELYQKLELHLKKLSKIEHDLDRGNISATTLVKNPYKKRVGLAMQHIADMQGEQLKVFPDIAFVRIKTDADPQTDLAYTIIRNKSYHHVTSMFQNAATEDARDFENDTLTVVDWLEGSYPNFFFAVAIEDIEDFTRGHKAIGDGAAYESFVTRYGMRRTNPEFWQLADWFHEQAARSHPVVSGLFDLNRYQNR